MFRAFDLLLFATCAPSLAVAVLAWPTCGPRGQIAITAILITGIAMAWFQHRHRQQATNRQLADVRDEADQRLQALLDDLRQCAHKLQEGMHETSQESRAVADGAEAQATSLAGLAAALAQITTTVTGCERNANDATSLARAAENAATLGTSATQQIAATIAEFEAFGQEVARRLGVVQDVAQKANLLALNATVEAARAGTAGRAFAVVAEEVRDLGQRCAEATRDVARLTEEANQRTQCCARIAADLDGALREVAAATSRCTTSVAQFASRTNEQSYGIQALARGFADVHARTRRHSDGSGALARAAAATSQQVETLTQLVADFEP